MIKFIAGLTLGLTISAAMAQVFVPSIMYGQKMFAPVIDCGPSNKAVFIVEQGIPKVVPFTEELVNRPLADERQ